MEQNNLTILCIEDDEDTCELVTFVFNQAGYQVEACSNNDCLRKIHEQKFLAIILDNYFVGKNGVDICRELREFDRTTPVIFFSGEARSGEINKAMAAGANKYLIKPNDFENLVTTTIKIIEELQHSTATN